MTSRRTGFVILAVLSMSLLVSASAFAMADDPPAAADANAQTSSNPPPQPAMGSSDAVNWHFKFNSLPVVCRGKWNGGRTRSMKPALMPARVILLRTSTSG